MKKGAMIKAAMSAGRVVSAIKCVGLSLAMLASAASAAEQRTFSYACRGGGFTIGAVVDRIRGAERWSKSQPVILRIAGESPQTLIADPDAAPEADSYRNKDFEFYSLKQFTTLTHKSHGVVVKFYNECRAE
jgi:hypothetical protein